MATPQQEEERTVEVSVDIEAPVTAVWNALVTDGGLGPWMGEGATIDPRPDGVLSFPDVVGGHRRDGRVTVVEDRHRLDFVWWRRDRPASRTEVSIVLESVDDRTRLTVTETVAARPVVGFQLPLPVESATARASATGASDADGPSAISRSRGLIGTWSWRLALVTLACTAARV
ncbi:MAG: SRPBCC domain-containing protein [Actinomycetota bacterium]